MDQSCSLHFCTLQAIKNWTVGRPGNEANCREHGFCFQFPNIRPKFGLLLVVSLSKRLACISSNEEQEHIYYVYLKDSCHLLSTYHRCLHKSSPPLEVGEIYWQLKGSVARYELLLLRVLKFQIQVQLPHPVSSQCLFMLACWSRVSLASFPGSSAWAERKSLVHTVCACSVHPGFLGIWKFSIRSAPLH